MIYRLFLAFHFLCIFTYGYNLPCFNNWDCSYELFSIKANFYLICYRLNINITLLKIIFFRIKVQFCRNSLKKIYLIVLWWRIYSIIKNVRPYIHKKLYQGNLNFSSFLQDSHLNLFKFPYTNEHPAFDLLGPFVYRSATKDIYEWSNINVLWSIIICFALISNR